MNRYIDGDALFSEVTNSYRWATGEARKAYRNVLDMICDADNKDVEEVRHAKWVDENCSNCGTRMPITTVYYRGNLVFKYEGEINYCPNCGAIIDKEKEE